jgi:hypothetical protein
MTQDTEPAAGEAVPAAPADDTAERQALEALRLDWGDAYLVSYDEEHGWRARRQDRPGCLSEGTPDELRAAMAEDFGPPRAGDLWCEACGKRAAEDGSGRAVHAATGNVTGPDGHLAEPVDREPPLWKAAREIAGDYRGAFTVTARFGFLQAYWSPGLVAPGAVAGHFEAPYEAEMRRKLDKAVAGTRWARQGAAT